MAHAINQAGQQNCANCVVFTTFSCQKAPERAVIQLHTADNGDNHIYTAHGYQADATAEPVWQDALRVELGDASNELQAGVVADVCLGKRQQGFNVEPRFAHVYAALDGHQMQPDQPLEDINVVSQYFHLPIEEASNVLGLPVTLLKKMCRRHGIQRWPYWLVTAVHTQVQQQQQ